MSLHDHGQHITIVDRAAEYDDFDGLRILAPSEVYHPHEWSSTRFFLSAIPDVHGLDVLEIGSGSGALALAIKSRGAKNVVATDISERACAAMECNALLNRLDIDIRYGDIFDPVRNGERFDLVIFNMPLMDKPVSSRSELALCDPGGELLSRFLREVPGIVRSAGVAMFTHATISAPLALPPDGQVRMLAESQRENGEIFRIYSWSRQ